MDADADEDNTFFAEMNAAMDSLCDAAMTQYNTTDATAAECLEELQTGLVAIGIEPDIAMVWQMLFDLKKEEEAAAAVAAAAAAAQKGGA